MAAYADRKTDRAAGRAAESPSGLAVHKGLNARSAVTQAQGTAARLNARAAPVQRKAVRSDGLPDPLRASMEAMSGLALDDVRVHRNSDKPAQMQALAYAQGTDIHLGPGQEKHLPHEAWHVVQQKQGRVRVTTPLSSGVGINADPRLEREADVMGAISVSMGGSEQASAIEATQPLPRFGSPAPSGQIQLYSIQEDGSKMSEHGIYITHETGHVDARHPHTVDMSRRTNAVDNHYYRWVPEFNVIGDCVAAMEELLHGKKLKYGVPDASLYRDSTSNVSFGDSDAKNRKRGRETDKGHDADPARGEAYLIARQTHARDEERPQFHGATVVAQDGSDNITLEATAPPSGGISAVRVRPIYDMYGTARKRRKQSFKTAYQAEYGKDATVSVLEAAKSLPPDAEAPARSRKVIDYEES